MPTKKQSNDLSAALTAAERKVITRRLRQSIVEQVFERVTSDIGYTIDKIIMDELKAAVADKKFMAEMRKVYRDEVKARLIQLADRVEIDF